MHILAAHQNYKRKFKDFIRLKIQEKFMQHGYQHELQFENLKTIRGNLLIKYIIQLQIS